MNERTYPYIRNLLATFVIYRLVLKDEYFSLLSRLQSLPLIKLHTSHMTMSLILSYLVLYNKVHNSITQIMKLSAKLLSFSWSFTSAPVHLVASLHFTTRLISLYEKKYTNRNASHPVLLQSGTSNYKNLNVLNHQSATVTWSIYGPVQSAPTACEKRW